MPPPNDPAPASVVEVWRLAIDSTSLFLINVRTDGSWQPFYIAPARFTGWTLRMLPAAPPTNDVDAAVRAWATEYGTNPLIRRDEPCKGRPSSPSRTASP